MQNWAIAEGIAESVGAGAAVTVVPGAMLVIGALQDAVVVGGGGGGGGVEDEEDEEDEEDVEDVEDAVDVELVVAASLMPAMMPPTMALVAPLSTDEYTNGNSVMRTGKSITPVVCLLARSSMATSATAKLNDLMPRPEATASRGKSLTITSVGAITIAF